MARERDLLLPEYLKCPMTLEIMRDPVLLPSGYTYERAAIQRWINDGNNVCPMTNSPIPNPDILVPNRLARALITSYLPHYQSPLPPSDSRTLTLTLTLPLTELVATLDNSNSAWSKIAALRQLTALLDSNPSLRPRIPESDAVAAILRCLDSSHSQLELEAISLLKNLTDGDDIRIAVVAQLVTALRGAAAATTALSIATLCDSQANRAAIGGSPGAIRTLISMITSVNGLERKSALTALFNLCSDMENRRRTVDCGAVPILVKFLSSGISRSERVGPSEELGLVVAVLGLLVKSEEGKEEISAGEGVSDIFLEVVSGTHTGPIGVYYGILVLDYLCSWNKNMKDEVKMKDGLRVCKRLMSDNDEAINKIATHLAKILEEG